MAGLLQGGRQAPPAQTAPASPNTPTPQQPPQRQLRGQSPRSAAPQGGDPRTDTRPQDGQQQYDVLASSMLSWLYEDGLPQVEQSLSSGGDIMARMARVISTIMITHYHALQTEGRTVPPGVMFQAGMELSKAVGELAIEMGRLPREQAGEAVEAAFMAAIGRFGQMASDSAMTDEQRQRYAEMIRTVRQLKQRAGAMVQGAPTSEQPPEQSMAPQQGGM
ncbi:hypothetical protein [Kushneria aurantia]|uniref:Uncharacterized protein n=1 Tax=Kushneria aurantia TaxID=504092 RepID=A0ABV6G4X3_9GAMM|nr:hypothetical protein [Kushneria aurantia]